MWVEDSGGWWLNGFQRRAKRHDDQHSNEDRQQLLFSSACTAKWASPTGLRVGEFMASFVLVAIFPSDLLSPASIRCGKPTGAIRGAGG